MSITHLSLFKRSNGLWYIVYTMEGRTRWKSTGEPTKSNALKKLTEFKELLESRVTTRTLSQFLRDFLSTAHTNYSKTTVDIFSNAMTHLKSIAGDCLLTSITPEHIELYKSKRMKVVRIIDGVEKPLSPVSINVELRALRALFNVALRWKLIQINPFSGVQLMKVPEVQAAFFSKNDFQNFISVIKESLLRDIFIFAVSSGLRRGEILNLRWEDIDFERKLIRIQSSQTFRTKHGKWRTLPMSDVCYQMLRLRIKESMGEYVFSTNGKQPLEDFVTHKFKEYVRLLGLDERLHFHSLRHTFATWLIQGGVNIYEVQKLLGHSSVKVTEIYSHLVASQLHYAVNKINISLN